MHEIHIEDTAGLHHVGLDPEGAHSHTEKLKGVPTQKREVQPDVAQAAAAHAFAAFPEGSGRAQLRIVHKEKHRERDADLEDRKEHACEQAEKERRGDQDRTGGAEQPQDPRAGEAQQQKDRVFHEPHDQEPVRLHPEAGDEFRKGRVFAACRFQKIGDHAGPEDLGEKLQDQGDRGAEDQKTRAGLAGKRRQDRGDPEGQKREKGRHDDGPGPFSEEDPAGGHFQHIRLHSDTS